jgi:hypothetical protein
MTPAIIILTNLFSLAIVIWGFRETKQNTVRIRKMKERMSKL